MSNSPLPSLPTTREDIAAAVLHLEELALAEARQTYPSAGGETQRLTAALWLRRAATNLQERR